MPRAPAEGTSSPCPVLFACQVSRSTRFCSLTEQLDCLKDQLAEEHEREVANLRQENLYLRAALGEARAQDNLPHPYVSGVMSSRESSRHDAMSRQDAIGRFPPSPYYRQHPKFKDIGMFPSHLMDEMASNTLEEKGLCSHCHLTAICSSPCKASESNAFTAGSQISLYDLLCETEETTPPHLMGGRETAGNFMAGPAEAWKLSTGKIPDSKLLKLSNEDLARADAENLAQMLKDGLPAEEPKVQQPSAKQIGFGRVGPVHSGLRLLANDMDDDDNPRARVPHGSRDFSNGASGARFIFGYGESRESIGYMESREDSIDCAVADVSHEGVDCTAESFPPCPTPATLTVSYDSDMGFADTPEDSREDHPLSDLSAPDAIHPGEEFSSTFKPQCKEAVRKDTPACFGPGVAAAEQALPPPSQTTTVDLDPVIAAQRDQAPVEKPVFNSHQRWSGLATGCPLPRTTDSIEDAVSRIDKVSGSLEQYSSVSLYSRSRLACTLAMFMLIGYDLVTVPLHVFDLRTTTFSRIWSIFAATFWTMDFVYSVATDTKMDGKISFEITKIFLACMKSRISLDFFLVISHWLTFALCEAGDHVSWPCFAIECLRLVRLLRIQRMLNATARLVVFAWVVNHVAACAWFGVSQSALNADVDHASTLSRYAWSLRWAPFARIYIEDFASLHNARECAFVIAAAVLFPIVIFLMLCKTLSLAMSLHQPAAHLVSQAETVQCLRHNKAMIPAEVLRVKAQVQADSLNGWPHALSPCCAARLARLREQIVTGRFVAL